MSSDPSPQDSSQSTPAKTKPNSQAPNTNNSNKISHKLSVTNTAKSVHD